MKDSHRGMARDRVTARWLVLVKIYGNSPMKLLDRIKKNTPKMRIDLPGAPWGPSRVLISLWIVLFTELINRLTGLGTTQKIGNKIRTRERLLIQFVVNTIDDEGSNTENRLFIIFS